MINSLTEAVGKAVKAEFGDTADVFTEEVRQGFSAPCFFVSCDNPLERLFFGTKYYSENQFCIQYFPKEGTRKRAECEEAAERLFEALLWLDVGDDLIMGRKMSHKTEKGVLSFFVSYDYYYYRQEKKPLMEQLTQRYGKNTKGEKSNEQK